MTCWGILNHILGQWAKKTSRLVSLSGLLNQIIWIFLLIAYCLNFKFKEQNLIDCTGIGCQGGNMKDAYAYIKNVILFYNNSVVYVA